MHSSWKREIMKELENPFVEIDQMARNLWEKLTVLTNTQKFE